MLTTEKRRSGFLFEIRIQPSARVRPARILTQIGSPEIRKRNIMEDSIDRTVAVVHMKSGLRHCAVSVAKRGLVNVHIA